MDIEYSDGQEIEGQILRLIRSASERGARHAIASDHYAKAWPIRYHLCPERANLLRPFNFRGLDVLELGAGMGAVSRFLAEEAQSLYVVEGTQPRFDVLRERLSDLKNWDGEVRNFQTFQTNRRFDVVCLVGVLEYSELFLSDTGGSPHLWLLQRCRQFLKPGGVLLVAIENALGLKYWSGAAEDHRATLFDGIVGYPDSPTPRTFSRKQLQGLLRSAGFGQVDGYYPYPDYKIPTTVVADALFECAPGLAAEIAALEPYRDYLGYPPIKYFSDTLAAENLSNAGLLPEFSNSFLFAASEPDSEIRKQLLGRSLVQGELAWHYGQGRRDATQTIFSADSDGGMRVQKTALYSSLNEKTYSCPGVGDLKWTALKAERVAPGRSLRSLLARRAYFDEWDSFLAELKAFLAWSLLKWKAEAPGQLRGEALDAILVNARRLEGGGYVLFDQEWSLEGSIPASWFVARNVFNLVREDSLLASRAPFASLADLYAQLCRALGIAPELSESIDKEARLQAVTSRGAYAHHRAQLQGLFDRRLTESVLPRSPASESLLRLPAQPWTPRRLAGAIRRRSLDLLGRAPRLKTVLRALQRRLLLGRDALVASQGYLRPKAFRFLPSDRGGEFTALVPGFPRGFLAIDLGNEAAPRSLTFGMRVDGSFVQQEVPVTRSRVVMKIDAEIESVVLQAHHDEEVTKLSVRRLTKVETALRLLPLWEWKALLKPKSLRAHLDLPVVDAYGAWVQNYGTLTAGDRAELASAVKGFAYQPLISVVMPVYNTDPRFLSAAIDSVVNQVYPHWELCLADDASTDARIRPLLEAYQRKDSRIQVVFRQQNGHISLASNSALEIAKGEFSALLDHDDLLAPQALAVIVESLQEAPDVDLVYSDEDKIDSRGTRYSPSFKPDWNPELFLAKNYICHLGVYRTSLLREIGGFRVGMEGSQDYDLALRFLEKTQRVRHVPEILYHWRAIPGSVALSEGEKSYAHDRAREAIRQSLVRRGDKATVERGFGFMHRVRWELSEPVPGVSVIIPTRDRHDLLRKVCSGLISATRYAQWELIIVDNQTTDPDTLEYFRELKQDPRVRILRYDAPFNYSAMINLAAGEAKHPLLALLNNDLEILSPEWLREMVAQAVRPEIGCVGAKLLYPNRTIQHAGVYLGIGGVADHLYRHAGSGSPIGQGAVQLASAVSAVTAACLAVRKEIFEKVGGFNAQELAVAYNDVDFCLRVREAGFRNVWTPYAQLVHVESANRGSDERGAKRQRLEKESAWMKARWGQLLHSDPYLSPNITLRSPSGSLAIPPRKTPFYRRLPDKTRKLSASKPTEISPSTPLT